MITATGWDYIGIIFENGRAILSKDKRPNETFMTDGFGLRNENGLDMLLKHLLYELKNGHHGLCNMARLSRDHCLRGSALKERTVELLHIMTLNKELNQSLVAP